ncbi:hypothetical protein D3C76_1241490 [compost metagenome]
MAFEQQDHRQRGGAHQESGPVGLALHHPGGDRPQVSERTVGLDRKTEDLRQLTDQHRDGDAVHVAVADRFGQQLGNEAQACDARQGNRAMRVAARQWQDDGKDHCRQRGIRPQHQDPAGAEQCISDERNDGRVQAIDAGHA